MQRQTNVEPAGLVGPSKPESVDYLLDFFWRLSNARPQTMGGAGAIPPSEILAQQQRYRMRLSLWEEQAIDALDGAWLKIQGEFIKKRDARAKLQASGTIGSGRRSM